MTTLHILRSEPDDQVRGLIKAMTPGEIKRTDLYGEAIDYDQLVDDLFSHDRVISWW